METTLTFDIIERARAELVRKSPPPMPEVRVFDFREQFRFPRTKKRRIRRKWAKNPANWRPQLGQCYKMELPGFPSMVVMGPDMKQKLDRMLLHQDEIKS